MTSRERVLAVMHHRMPDRPPWIEIGFHTAIASKVSGRDAPRSNSGFHSDADLNRYESELDLFIEAALRVGLDVVWLKHWNSANFAGEKGSAYDAGTIKCMADWERAIRTAPNEREHPWYKCVEVFVKKVRETDLAMGFQTSLGFGGVWHAMGFRDFCMGVYDQPELIVAILDWYVERQRQIVRDFFEYDPDLIVLGDDIAFGQGPVISPPYFNDLFLPRMKQVAQEAQCPWLYHSDGNLMPVMDGLLTLGMTALHPIEPYGTMDIREVKRRYGHRLVLAGNLDMNLIALGTMQDIEQGVRWLFENVGYDGRWMLSSSNSIDSGANVENVIAMGKAARTLTYAV